LLAFTFVLKYKPGWLAAICCLMFLSSAAQSFEVDNNRKNVSIPFRAIRNMVVIKLSINGKGPYNFILDTGVGLMIITEPKLIDSLSVQKRTIKLSGLSEGDDFEAFVTAPLKIQIPGLSSEGVGAAILKKDYFNLSGYVGMPIHGLLGYDFFNSLAVKISFNDSTITVCRPMDLRPPKKSQRLNIDIQDKKPYLDATVTFAGGKKVSNKLIIDLGAGHPLSLENQIAKNGLPKKSIVANLGVALNGPISGYIGRIEAIELGKYKLKNVITSFPNDHISAQKFSIERDGNMGIGILKKFDVIFDYAYGALYLKPNKNFNKPYEYDMSGLEYYAAGENLDRLIISRVEPGSAGADIGLKKDDEIVSINFTPVIKMSIEEIDQYFKSKDERSILLEIYRDNKFEKLIITLKRRI
jgi:hypothetical protein